MLRCTNCEDIFNEDEVDYKNVCLEVEYGITSLFPNRTYKDVPICPRCRCDILEEYFEEAEL